MNYCKLISVQQSFFFILNVVNIFINQLTISNTIRSTFHRENIEERIFKETFKKCIAELPADEIIKNENKKLEELILNKQQELDDTEEELLLYKNKYNKLYKEVLKLNTIEDKVV